MDWIYFVVLSSLSYTATDILDKFLVDKRVKSHILLPLFVRMFSVVPLLFIALFTGFSIPGPFFILLTSVAAVFSVAGVLIYYKALQSGEVSRVIPLYQFLPIFVLILSFVFIGEVLGALDYIGIIILVIGGLVITARSFKKLLKVEKIFWLVLFSSFLISVSYVIMKFVMDTVESWDAIILLWSLQAVLFSSFFLSKKIRSESKCFNELGLNDKVLIFADAIVSIVAFAFNYIAISLGPVTLVEAAGNMLLVFVFIATFLISRYIPRVLKEDFDAKAVMHKIIGMALIILGLLLTQIS
jgi:transporter family protein